MMPDSRCQHNMQADILRFTLAHQVQASMRAILGLPALNKQLQSTDLLMAVDYDLVVGDDPIQSKF
jgi:hypothetical protein